MPFRFNLPFSWNFHSVTLDVVNMELPGEAGAEVLSKGNVVAAL